MDDDKLKQLFRDFDPDMKSDELFMTRLQHRLDSVEMVKEHNDEVIRRSRTATVIAASVGLIAGLLLSLALPYIGAGAESLKELMPTVRAAEFIADNYLVIAWGLIGATATAVAVNAYDLSLSLLKKRK